MEHPKVQVRTETRRKPLADGTQQANATFHSARSAKGRKMSNSHQPADVPSSDLPHHESLNANGPLTVHSFTTSPENKRLSAVTNDESESKRNSQVSTTSTNASGKTRRRKTHVGPWELGSDVGKGGIGRVRKVRHAVTGETAAVKIISKRVAEKARAESLANLVESSKSKRHSVAEFNHVMPFGIEREVIIMKLLEHPNIVKLYDIWENRSELYLVMEYVSGGELFDYISEREFLAEDETVYLFRQMLAALLHCHRIGIHHRDLKPENILLDQDTLKVKLVDFGMAALQPKGRNLTTPCGSLHYAAPEVFKKSYDGSKIDVWSLGIILFVMLTGTTPFFFDPKLYEHDMEGWQALLASGKFHVPEELSPEAQDLIRKMLKPDPKKRISLEDAWYHPLLHKYETAWGEPANSGRLENWIGATPSIKEWKVRSVSDIDRELLRNLRTLWHSEREEVLIRKLIDPEPNHEKYFYYALMKHREEQLENFTPTQDHLRYSSSDYHHLQGQAKRVSAPGANPRPASRSKSQFSILNDEHLQSRNSILEPPPSERSYDPYRASKDPIVKDKDGYSVTVHTGASRHSQKQATTQTLRHPPSLRVEALKKEQRRISTASSSASLGNSRASLRSKRTLSRHSMSRASLASSNIPSSPPVIVRPSNKHKRPVNFSHLRKSSTASALDDTQSTNATLTPRKRASRIKQSAPDIRDPLSSPAIYFQSPVRSKKETQASSAAQARQHGHTNSQVINTEARKVSTELGRFCEEAFNRSSGSSSHRTSATASQTPYDTPPSSISNQNSTHSVHGQITPAGPKRPLPEVPAETPNSYAARELAETRNRLAARYVADPSASSQTYTEVLAHLDALLKRPLPAADSKRAVSLPEPKYSAFFSELPAISEEKQPDSDIKRASKDATDSHAGAAEHAGLVKIGAPEKHVPTIRMVEPSSPHRPAPLNIRKTSSATTATLNGNALRSPLDGAAARQKVSRITTPTSPKQLDMFTGRFGGNLFSPTDDSAPTKKRPWWRRNKTPDAGAEKPHSPKSWEDLDDSTRSPASVELDRRAKRISDPRTEMHYMSGALAVQEPASLKGKRPGFLKFFERSPKSYVEQDYGRIQKEDFEPSTPSTRTGFSGSDRTNPPIRRGRREHAIEDVERSDLSDLGIQQNWLSKFLHIKPATRVTCFQTTRGRTRGEVVRLLDNWRVHGIRDVVLDKERNRIFARLDATNALGLKEVEFVIELFVVLYQGRKKGLSIARWTQRKGAASSFRRVVQEVEARLQSKGLLVSDKEMKKDMEAVLADGLGR